MKSKYPLTKNSNSDYKFIVLVFVCFQPRMEQYFQQMGKIVKDTKNSARVRFMLQDVVDLRYIPLPLH